MIRRLIKGLAVGAALSLALAGCTTEGDPADPTAPTQTSDGTDAGDSTGPKNGESYVFGNIAYNMQDVWNKYGADAFEFATGHVDESVEVVTLDAENSLEKSVQLMEDLISRDVDGISVFPISPEQAATLGRMANDAGIPITFENTVPDLEESEYISVIAAEYDLIGEEAMNYIAETYPGAKVLYVAGARGGGVYETYQEGIDRAMEALGDQIEIVDTVHGDWETELSMNVTADVINAGTEFDVVFANNEQMGKGVKNALDEAGMSDIPIVATGGGPDGLKMIEDGDITATISAPVSLQGLITFKNLYQSVVLGNTPEKFTPLPLVAVDAGNVSEAVSWEPSDAAVEFIGGIQ